MEAVGRMAGGIAHDFNNLLTLITLNSEVLLSKFSPNDHEYTDIENIIKSVRSASTLTEELLLFSRNRIMNAEIINVNEIIEKFLKTVGHFVQNEIQLQTIMDDRAGLIEIDPIHLEQVFMNLIINSMDAMPNGGDLTIQTKQIPTNQMIHEGKSNDQSFIEISIVDTGIGMDEEIKEKIFEPFFTTKEEGKGTGLGLATTYSIIQQSNGFMRVRSELGKGTQIQIYLPEISIPEEITETQEIDKAYVLKKDDKIMVVDDDDSIRQVIKNILIMNGFDVLEAGSALDGLQIYKENKNQIKLVISDIVMPNMRGTEFVDQIKLIDPTIKVLFITAHTKDFQSISAKVGSDLRILQKPFDSEDLINNVKQVLNN
jgi:nitrogen fixation/metabolism regulation signal transduction histidine kinase